MLGSGFESSLNRRSTATTWVGGPAAALMATLEFALAGLALAVLLRETRLMHHAYWLAALVVATPPLLYLGLA